MKLSDFVDINPRTTLVKGAVAEFVPMEALDPQRRYARSYPKKKYSGGTKFINGDTLFARITPCLENGKIAQFVSDGTEPAFGSTEYWVLRAKEGVSDPSYVYYLAKSDLLRRPAEKSMVGASGRQRAQIESIQDIDVSDIDITDQQRVASILTAYDDLIENNSKRIEKLESIARLLYHQYFEVPEASDWEQKPIKDFGEVVTGKTPSKTKSENYSESGTMFIKTPDMHGNLFVLDTAEKLSVIGVNTQKNKTLPAGSICISCIGTVGVVSIMTAPSQTNQQINTIVLNDDRYREYIFMKLQASKQILENLGSNGATMTNVNKTKLEEMKIARPPHDKVLEFHKIAKPYYGLILVLQRRNQKLLQSRDLLLPRLMSGEIEL